MDGVIGLLRVRVKRGFNLAVRDTKSSDPYVVVKMGQQKLRTNVVWKNVNPIWDEDLTLSISDPNLPIRLIVHDYDTFNKDDKMGDAVFDIQGLLYGMAMALRIDLNRRGVASAGTVIARVIPSRENCLAEESLVSLMPDGKVVQDMVLRLRNVECGELQISLHWIDLPASLI